MKLLWIILLSSLNLQASELKLVGKSLLEYSIFKIDVYEIAYLKAEDGTEEIRLDYKVDVAKKHSVEGWKISLSPIIEKNPSLAAKRDWIIQQTVDYSDGDRIVLRKRKDQVMIFKNNQLLAEVKDAQIADLIHAPWIGEFPIDKQIKQELLGNES